MENWSTENSVVGGSISQYICVNQYVCICVYDHPMALLSQCLNEHVSSFSPGFKNRPSPTQCLAGWLLLYTWHMSLCWFTCRPLINKWGLAQEVEKLSWPICDRTRGQGDESGEGRWGTAACLSFSPNLVFVRSGRIRTRAHMLSSLTPDPQRLISVSDKVEQQVHSALHNKSISRVIEFHQSPLPLLRPAGSVPRAQQRPLPWDYTTVIIQLHSFLPS